MTSYVLVFESHGLVIGPFATMEAAYNYYRTHGELSRYVEIRELTPPEAPCLKTP